MSSTTIDRLATKTLDQRFRQELEQGFELAPRVAQGVLETAKQVFNLNAVTRAPNGQLRPGQIRQVIARESAPHGRPLEETEMVEVVWTLDAGEEDLDVLKEHGRVTLRRIRILRLVEEALEQGGEPTQEDLSKALGVTVRTIRSDVAALEADGHQVATRGKLRGVGRGQTHKVIIVELYLKRHTYTEIMRRTRHSVSAIKRYIQTFGRVVMLTRKGLSISEVAYAVGSSERLAQEYLDLYHRYKTPEYQGRLAEIVQRVSGRAKTPAEGAKKGVI